MSPKFIFLFASLCVVTASVVNINVFGAGDEADTQLTHSGRGCNNLTCNQLCRIFGFSSGSCDNGHCKCYRRQDSGVKEDSDTSDQPQLISNCYYRACKQRCQRHGYSGGACVNGRCKCNNDLNVEYNIEDETTDGSENVMPESISHCYYRECEQRCRRLGYPGSACVNGRCKCDDFLSAEYSSNGAPISELLSSGSCYRRECIFRCRQQGFNRGICINGHCKCNNYERTVTGAGGSEDVLPESVSHCYYRECEQRCRRYGYPGGACVNGRCKCDDAEYNIEGGTTDESENAISQSVTNCYYRECEQRCRRLGFPGGACVNGRCKCDDFLSAEYSSNGASTSELLSPGSCYRRECIHQCRQQGFNRSLCIHGQCKCNNYAETAEDASSVSSPTAEAADNEINLSLEKEKEDYYIGGVGAAPCACDAGQCNTICHHIEYTPIAGAEVANANVIN